MAKKLQVIQTLNSYSKSSHGPGLKRSANDARLLTRRSYRVEADIEKYDFHEQSLLLLRTEQTGDGKVYHNGQREQICAVVIERVYMHVAVKQSGIFTALSFVEISAILLLQPRTRCTYCHRKMLDASVDSLARPRLVIPKEIAGQNVTPN